MTLRLTPDILRGAFDFLKTTPPFSRWRLPESDDIEFHVGRAKDCLGHYEGGETAEHRIAVHETGVGFTITLLEVMAHEIIHLRLANTKDCRGHGAAFKRLARLVCKYHGFDPKRF